MKKTYIIKCVVLALLVLCFGTTTALAASATITMEINGKIVQPDADPFITNNVTMVPLRFASSPLDAQLSWDNVTKQATLSKEGLTVVLTVGDKNAMVNGEQKTLLAAAKAQNGRIFVPLRFIAENLGANVNWLKEKSTVQIQFPAAMAGPQVIGYYYDADSLTMLDAYSDTFDGVIHFAYSVDGSGCVNKKANYDKDLFQGDACSILDSDGIKTQALVSCFAASVSDQLLNDPALRTAAVANIVDMVYEDGYSGVDLDFEAVSVAARDNFTAFVKELKRALGNDMTLSLSLRARSSDRQTWLDGYDYASLSRYADRMIVMLYNQHYAGGTPGPVAGIDWMEDTIQYLSRFIPQDKFYAGLGAYGYSWPASGAATSVHIDRAYELAEKYQAEIRRDAVSGVPWFDYVDENGVSRQLWFEDAASMAQKAALAKEYGLAGIAIWRMGIVPDDVWQAVVDAVQ